MEGTCYEVKRNEIDFEVQEVEKANGFESTLGWFQPNLIF